MEVVNKVFILLIYQIISCGVWQNNASVGAYKWYLSLRLNGIFINERSSFGSVHQYHHHHPHHHPHQENGDRAARLMACIGVTSLIGRLIFGFVSDLPLIRKNGNRIILQQVR